MPAPFPQTVIAVVWDFDKTLIPGNMQGPLFAHYGIDERAFWEEVDQLADFYRAHGAGRVNQDVLYLNHILEYVRAGRMRGLNNRLLHELGRQLTFHPGMPELLDDLRAVVSEDPIFSRLDLSVEHYVVSTGLRPMIEGSAIRPYLEDVWACEFIEAHHPPGYLQPAQAELFGSRETVALAYQIDNTSKTRALFEINKGTNKAPEIHVNAWLPREFRRVPFEHMIYVADGPSDIPAWSVVRGNGGLGFGVYQPGSRASFEQISGLLRDGRIHAFAEADYRPNTTAWLWLSTEIRRIAEHIVEERTTALRRAIRPPARHLPEEPAAPDLPGAEEESEPAAPHQPASEAAPAPDTARALEGEVERATPPPPADAVRAAVRASLDREAPREEQPETEAWAEAGEEWHQR